jgi:Protein of unknown function (DUF1553)/Protein of unknown function (DUF1549)/Planctomycete cytochrome C
MGEERMPDRMPELPTPREPQTMRRRILLLVLRACVVPSVALLACVLLLLTEGILVGAETPSVQYERDVRPILARCVSCHGPGKQRSGLRLDSRPRALAEADSGSRAIVPGKPDQSELLRRVHSQEPGERMPPKGEPLTSVQIATLRRWIAAGAEWPEHWAYRPLKRPPIPPLSNPGLLSRFRDWPRTPIDQFILARQADLGLSPALAADKRTLLRRLSFDLIGLPPTPQEMDSFLADTRRDAYERAVDRLLANPQYGERWARHWMDIVHYAETHGHDQDRPRENAWPYRDYLIRAFNEDRSYARFVQEQVAGDILFPGNAQALAATGFLATGPWDESSLRDIREDSIDRQIGRNLDRDDIVTTVISTFVSTTVHCARCHDHKFDPIRQEEYYGLQAVFSGIDKANRPYDQDPAVAARRRQLAEQVARLEHQKQTSDPALLTPSVLTEVAAWERSLGTAGKTWQVLRPDGFRSAEGATLTRMPDDSIFSGGKRPEKDTVTATAHTDLKGITAFRLEVMTDDRLAHRGPGRQDNGNLHLNEFSVTAGSSSKPLAWQSVKADFNQQGWTIAHAIDGKPATAWGIYPQVGQPHQAVFILKGPVTLPSGAALTFTLQQTHGGGHLIGRLRLSVTTATRPDLAAPLPTEVAAALALAPDKRTDAHRITLAAYLVGRKLEQEQKALPAQSLVYCGTPTFAPDRSFRPAGGPRPVHVLKRGDIKSPGALARPGALSCVPGLEGSFRLKDPANEGERRGALARWLTDRRNGLAWRSMANRLWQYHFGRGLVATPNDFGKMGSPPTHPELLDWLACELRDTGSLKRLHRLIVTSAAYRQSCRHEPAFAAKDADNRYLWRMNRRRLDAESLRDAVLRISGKLDPTMGGPSVRQFIQKPGVHVTPVVDYLNFNVDDPANYRRSVYRFVFRTLPDPFMETLDCPDGSQLAPRRTASVTALQALALLNDKFMVRQAEHVAARCQSLAGPDVGRQVATAYRLILGRSPTTRESQAVGDHVRKHGLVNACRVLLNSNEFVFVE